MKGDEFLINIHDKYPDIISILLTGQPTKKPFSKQKKSTPFLLPSKTWTEEELFEKLSSGLKKLD